MADTASLVVRVKGDGIKKTSGEIDKLSGSSRKVNSAAASMIKQLELQNKSFRKSQKEINLLKASMEGASKEELRRISILSDSIAAQNRFNKYMKAGAVAVGVLVAAVGAAAVALGRDAVAKNRVFEKSLSDLSAITGATGDQLGYLKAQALDIGAATQLSASQAAEAFKLIASAKPDLLESSSALNDVTRSAVTLAEAAGIELPDAARALGSAMNQFGADAAEANRYINILAASSKFGAQEIPAVADGLKNSGSAAASANVSFEETNAALQLLAQNAIVGAEGGTALRNIILKLETSADKNLRPSINGLSGALKNFAEQGASATDISKKFGVENYTAAVNLLNNVGALDELTTKLTGTNTAFEQATIRTNNLDGDIKNLSSAYETLALVIGDKLNPAARESTQFLTGLTRDWAILLDKSSDTPTTVDGLALKLGELREQLAETQARTKRFGANNIWDAITGGAGDREKQVADLQAEIDRLMGIYERLRGFKDDSGAAPSSAAPVTPTQTPTPVEPPTTSEGGQAALDVIKQRLELYKREGVERAKFAAVQSLGVNATKQEKDEAAKLAAEIYKLNEARKNKGQREAGKQQAESYLESIRQMNLTELELVDAKNAEKIAKLDEYKQKGLISESQHSKALTELEAAAQEQKLLIKQMAMDRELQMRNEYEQYFGEIGQNEFDRLNEREQAKLDLLKAYNKKGLVVGRDYEQKLTQINRTYSLERAKATGNEFGNMANNVKMALGEASSEYKAFAIMQATVATYTGAIEAYKSASAIPIVGWILGPIAAAAAVAAGVANIAKIRSAREQGGYMSAGSAYQMAERGKAEVIVPASNSRARTAAQMREIMGQNQQGQAPNVTIVNQTSGRVDNATVESQSDGSWLLRIEEFMSDRALDPDSMFSKSLKAY